MTNEVPAETNTTPLTTEEIFAVLVAERKYIRAKVKEGIKFKLRKTIASDELEELISDAQYRMMEQALKGKTAFISAAKVVGYVLFACWCNYRTLHYKKTTANKTNTHQDDWMVEGLVNPPVRRREYIHVNLEDLLDTGVEFAAEPPRIETDSDLRDSYYSELWEKLFTYLDDCILDEFFTFREVGIYKVYILNRWSMKRLVSESDYSRAICFDAVKKIREHLKTVHWYLTDERDS
ncbi:hypothetical protein I2I05_08615 [Hymenobacter sp. BT683]|uniref:Sigma-70 family RNA polymerase sigma factor n=1 Tax=Hymenobacter jeongseonensis TaxID=2791027 RepID=A0ABS0IGH2_9BACT|nr:hypothetical protein [Hymenobacter jeongseonensis]MBF9237459.1 hypothetical protein [Hymenobacter jeongseonensis]